MKKITILLSLLFISLFSIAQEYSSKNKKAIAAYETALQNYQLLYYDKAEENLKTALKQDEYFSEAYYLLAGVYTQKKDTTQMLHALQTCVDKCGGTNLWSRYKLAYEEYDLGMYKEAFDNLQHFKRANEMHTSSTLSKVEENNFNDLYEKTTTALKLQENPVNFTPKNLGKNINTQFDDYHPSITVDDNTIIFTTNLPTNNPRIKQEDLFSAQKVNDEWNKSTPLTSINTSTNEGAQSITADGKTMFFTICGAPNGLGSCDIYMAKKFGNTWTKPINLGEPINSKYWESQPSCSADGRTLYFASNRPGGIGKKDLYVSHLQSNGKWSKPANLGEEINTKYDDESPYIHADGQTLYFATDGRPGMGKKDIFATKIIASDNSGTNNRTTWATPENLGYPINTYEDEAHLIINAEGTKGYFASNRFGGFGGFDIYEFTIDETFKVKPNPVTYVTCFVFDAETKVKLGAQIILSDITNNEKVFISNSDQFTGECIVPFIEGHEYALSVEKAGYLFYSETVSLSTFKGSAKVDIPLQKIIVGNYVVLKNIFFDTDKTNYKRESEPEVEAIGRFMKQNPTVHVEIEGHTDNVGNATYNQTLSEKRAKFIALELIKIYGIQIERLSWKGYGSTKPCAPNDTPENRAKNRRTQLIITAN
ncbi:MAG: OmpA family protein [Bacteroidales bacterium]|nr:OmpA family protein [Bacteroidales bacterium]